MKNETMELDVKNNAPTVGDMTSGEMALVTREQAEVQAAYIIAKRFPRNEVEASVKALRSVERQGMAEKATYSYPRGSSTISGPSVYLARDIARAWGNVQCGHRIVSIDETQVHIVGYAIDMESNTRVEIQDRFERLVQRKVGKGPEAKTVWVKPDERDLRELTNKRGAIAMRNAILQVLPADLIEDCVKKARETVKGGAKKGFKDNKKQTVKELAMAFGAIAVNVEMLEDYLGHGLDVLSEDEYVELRGIWKSISDGVAKREEFFVFGETESQPKSRAEEALTKTKE